MGTWSVIMLCVGAALMLAGMIMMTTLDRKSQKNYYDAHLPLRELWRRALHDWRYLSSVELMASGFIIISVAVLGCSNCNV